MEAAGLSKTDYQLYLDTLREEIPVVTANFCRDAAGNLYTSDDSPAIAELLNEYAIVQYNQIFDEDDRLWEAFLP